MVAGAAATVTTGRPSGTADRTSPTVAALAPSAATPSREAAEGLIQLSSGPEGSGGVEDVAERDEADGMERRSSASVLKSRPLVGV